MNKEEAQKIIANHLIASSTKLMAMIQSMADLLAAENQRVLNGIINDLIKLEEESTSKE